MSERADDLRGQWDRLVAGAGRPSSAGSAGSARAVGDRLLSAYAEGHRRYHDQRHLAEVLAAIDHLATGVDGPHLDSDLDSDVDLTAVRFAAWFHDAVYDPQAPAGQNEEASAQLAEQLLPGLDLTPERVRAIAALVRGTAEHDGASTGSPESALLDDADLAILASSTERYADYAAAVRVEYAHVPDATFRDGRRRILQDFLDRARIYRTARAHDAWEASARAQVAAEVRALS